MSLVAYLEGLEFVVHLRLCQLGLISSAPEMVEESPQQLIPGKKLKGTSHAISGGSVKCQITSLRPV